MDHLTACLSGSAPTDRQLLAQAKLQLELGWRDRLDSFDFKLSTREMFTRRLEAELEVTYPVLRRRVEYLSINKTDPLRQGESPVACLNMVVKALTIAGMGTR